MGKLAPGHFSITPDDHEGREMLTTVFADSAGKELNVTFKATINMEMSPFEKLAKNKFKGVYWITEEPHRESSEEYQKMHQKRQEEWLEKKLDLEEKIKAAKVRRLYDVTIVKDEKRYNCEQIVAKLCEGMPWVKSEDATEYAWRVRELGEATVLTTSDPGIAGLIKNS